MKLYMHPVSMTSRPVRLFIAENKIPVDEELVDVMTGAQYQLSLIHISAGDHAYFALHLLRHLGLLIGGRKVMAGRYS